MNRLPIAKQKQILHLMCSGMSMRAITRTVDCSINTVTKLLVNCGRAAKEYQNTHHLNLTCKNVQVDEIWSFCHTKRKNCTQEKLNAGHGDIWTWTAIDSDTRLMIHWEVGSRDLWVGKKFMDGLSQKLGNRIQLSADGYSVYGSVADGSFDGGKVDFGILNKKYENDTLTLTKLVGMGNPIPEKISTSCVERSNLTLRMENRRFTRHTNAHSKKAENHEMSVSLYFMYYNYARVHSSLRITPAMASGLTDHVWEMGEILGL